MNVLQVVCLVFALVLFVLAGVPIPTKYGLGWFGAAFAVAALLVPLVH